VGGLHRCNRSRGATAHAAAERRRQQQIVGPSGDGNATCSSQMAASSSADADQQQRLCAAAVAALQQHAAGPTHRRRLLAALAAVSSACLQGVKQHEVAVSVLGLVGAVVDQIAVNVSRTEPTANQEQLAVAAHTPVVAETPAAPTPSISDSGSGGDAAGSSGSDTEGAPSDGALRVAAAAVEAAADLGASAAGRQALLQAGAVGAICNLLASWLLPCALRTGEARSPEDRHAAKRQRQAHPPASAPLDTKDRSPGHPLLTPAAALELTSTAALLLAELLLNTPDAAPRVGQLTPLYLRLADQCGCCKFVRSLLKAALTLPPAAKSAAAAVAGRVAMELPLRAAGDAAATDNSSSTAHDVLATLLGPVSSEQLLTFNWQSSPLLIPAGAAAAAAPAATNSGGNVSPGGDLAAALESVRGLTSREVVESIMPTLVQLVDADADESNAVAVRLLSVEGAK